MEKDQRFSWTDVPIAEGEAKAAVRIQDRLLYHVPEFLLQKLQARPKQSTYWSYEWYQNAEGKKVKISYASTREASEKLAQKFLNEKVLGFDMEWKADFKKKRRRSRTLKDEISLIQVASAHEIGLFHIALHKGNSPAELIARSLRTIIETKTIIKTGVGIYSADAFRLRKFMGLKPQGILDLNRLHRIVDVSSASKMVSLSNHAKIHLGFPLFKGDVRTSDWTKALTTAQQNYAASDAYVGLVLYHVLDVERLNMDPIPPHPELDKDPVIKMVEPAPTITAEIPPKHITRSRVSSGKNVVRYQETCNVPHIPPATSVATEPSHFKMGLATPAPTVTQPMFPSNTERRLLANLHSLRFRLQKSTGQPRESIASDKTLQEIAGKRPTKVLELCRIPGGVALYKICIAQKVNIFDCIITPPTSISFDSSLSCTQARPLEIPKRQPLAALPVLANCPKRFPPDFEQPLPKKKQRRLSASTPSANFTAHARLGDGQNGKGKGHLYVSRSTPAIRDLNAGLEDLLPRKGSAEIPLNIQNRAHPQPISLHAENDYAPSSSLGVRPRNEGTQVILDTPLATAALDFQLSSDPHSPYHRQH